MGKRTYRLTVEGELGDNLAWAFPGMTITPGDGITTLAGELRDQAELQGVLHRVSDLGLTLLETKTLESRPEGRSGHDSAHTDAAERQPLAAPRTKKGS